MSSLLAPPRPIDTQYKGFVFRSRLEARYAVFFDALDIKWEYEKEGYELPSGKYLPDFWIESAGLRAERNIPGSWVEIKPKTPSQIETRKCLELTHHTRCDSIIMWGGFEAPESGESEYESVIEHAARMAKSARFEYGYSGPIGVRT